MARRNPAVPTAAIASAPSRPASAGHRGDRLDRALHRLGLERARLVEPFAEARDVGAIDDRAPLAVRGPLADVELDRVRTDIDDRVAPRAEAGERLQAPSHVHVGTGVEAELAHGGAHA